MSEDLGEKTEQPTARRLSEARKEGQVARSQDFSSAVLLAAMTLALALAAMPMLETAGVMIRHALSPDTLGIMIDSKQTSHLVAAMGQATAKVLVPVLVVAVVAALVSHIGQFGFIFSSKALVPKIEKLNPISGAKRIYGINAIVKAGLDSFKVLFVMLVAIWAAWDHAPEILALPQHGVLVAAAATGWLLLDTALRMLAVLFLLGILDFIYQRWKNRRDLRMTKQQVKDELKQTDGDPETKRRRMRIQQQIAMHRISAAVPKADVIVTNPEHISIALSYDSTNMEAPRVLAKGADFMAMRIRAIATEHNIPIVERKPLARALYREVEVGEEIPESFFQTVAEILAYVYRLQGRMAG